MAPLGIDILMHYVTRADDYRNGDFSAPAVEQLISAFVTDGLLERNDVNVSPIFRASAGAHLYVKEICKVPLPVMKWTMP